MNKNNSDTYTYLKLGGSLITDKQTPLTARVAVIQRIANEIAEAKKEDPALKLIMGHGSGSFGHSVAKKYGTVDGVNSFFEWQGFCEVWFQARTLNQIVTEAFHKAGLPVLSIDISSHWISDGHQAVEISLDFINLLLEKGIVPLVYGNVLTDDSLGGTIFSTEEIFSELCKRFVPERILIAGIEDGIWEDFPKKTKLLQKITPVTIGLQEKVLQKSAETDVTGGMKSKVEVFLPLLKSLKKVKILIFNGVKEGNIKKVLLKTSIIGTWLENI